jgi:hypothetical protein
MASDIIPEQSIIRRNRPGTKGADFYNWPDQDFNDMETTLSGKLVKTIINHEDHH